MEDFNHYFKDLKKTMEGKENYYFLVNDSNNEIRQHYDNTYNSSIDINKFIQSIISKKQYFHNEKINYEFFVIPDKSITAREFLPFKTDSPKRIVDYLSGLVNDLKNIITLDDVLKNDTHVSVMSSLKITPYILSTLHGKSPEFYRDGLNDKLAVEVIDHKGDLFFIMNWSYPKDERFKTYGHIDLENLVLRNDYTKVNLEDIPQEYRYVSKRESEYYINPNSISDKKAIILRDSSTNSIMTSLIAYYREVFFYWDHWYFNKELVEWFNPDDVIEIRTERFLENPEYPLIENDFKIKQKLILNLENFKVYDKKLDVKFNIMDYYNRIIDSSVDIYINDVLFKHEHTVDSIFDKSYDLSDYSLGEYIIKVVVNETDTTKEFKFTRNVLISEDINKYFKSLKSTLKGKDNTFFLVNDITNEISQHYDLSYNSPLNVREFKLSLDSKRKYIKDKNIQYAQFIIPDKSILLKDYLPFETAEANRHFNRLKNYYYDLSEVLDCDDYLVNDTKITPHAAIKSAAYILFKTYKQDSFKALYVSLLNCFDKQPKQYKGDLFTDNSWSYTKDDVYGEYSNVTIEDYVLKDNIKVTSEDIPAEYKIFNNVKSLKYSNENSLSDKRVLIICDKSIQPLFDSFKAYYREVFIYHDFWYFNKDLLDYYKPDTIIEVRSERFLDGAIAFVVNENSRIRVPVKIKVDAIEIREDKLNVAITCMDIRRLTIQSTCKFFIDDDLKDEVSLDDGKCHVQIDIANLNRTKHTLKIRLEESDSTKASVLTKEFIIE